MTATAADAHLFSKSLEEVTEYNTVFLLHSQTL